MTSKHGKQAIAIYMFPISQDVKAIRQWSVTFWSVINDNLIISYVTRETFFLKNHKQCGAETIPWRISTKLKLSKSLDQ